MCGDARELADHVPGDVEICLLANALHGVGEPTPFVEAVADVLAPDGQFVVVNRERRP